MDCVSPFLYNVPVIKEIGGDFDMSMLEVSGLKKYIRHVLGETR